MTKITELQVTIEIDHERGVIYAHLNDIENMQLFGTQTVLRICGLPTPIPHLKQIDITHMIGVSYTNGE